MSALGGKADIVAPNVCNASKSSRPFTDFGRKGRNRYARRVVKDMAERKREGWAVGAGPTSDQIKDHPKRPHERAPESIVCEGAVIP